MTNSSFNYPVNISLKGKKCLLFGFGKVGRRKLKALLAAGVSYALILDLQPSFSLADMDLYISEADIVYDLRDWREEDLRGVFLVFACSSDRERNLALSELCAERNILCDNATDPEAGSFISPALVSAPPLVVTIGTGGASPLLAAKLKRELYDWLQPRAALAELMGLLRAPVLNMGFTQAKNREIFQFILASPIAGWLAAGKYALCEQWLLDSLSFLTKNELEEIFTRLKQCSRPIR